MNCTIETGWACPANASCYVVCGDSLIIGSETCDDGNAVSGDGCSNICRIEPGYNCTINGTLCTTICGDAILTGSEGCDDGNTLVGDGCDSVCQT
jgi:cysteine-rich repeat protein